MTKAKTKATKRKPEPSTFIPAKSGYALLTFSEAKKGLQKFPIVAWEIRSSNPNECLTARPVYFDAFEIGGSRNIDFVDGVLCPDGTIMSLAASDWFDDDLRHFEEKLREQAAEQEAANG